MDPGTGKTLTSLVGFHELKRRKLVDKLLVTAPLRVAYEVWPQEIEKWKLPYTCKVLHGDNKDKLLDAADEDDTDIWIINYEGWDWLFNRVPWQYWKKKRWWLMLDESTRVKRTSTGTFKTIEPILPLFARRTILTGTPAPNGLEDLFGQVKICDLGEHLGEYVTQFRREYFYPMGFEWRLQPDGEERIWKELDGMFYRVSDEVLGLPPLERVRIDVRLPDKARKLYDKLEVDFIADIEEGKVTAVNAGVLSSKLRQIANGTLYDNEKNAKVVHNEKMDALGDLLDELGSSPLLLGYEFTHDGERIAKKFKAPIVNGKTNAKEATEIFKQFNKGDHAMLVLQMKSGSHGLNLQAACNHVAMYNQTWDLEIYEQFYKRVRRSGQAKTVFLHEFMTKNTVETLIHSIVITGKGSKKQRQDRFLKAVQERQL